ncbi:MAG: hypothetical protein LBE31_11230 [Deltaproteobacteria bacterium]|nr:hypothetical protein [Deltaproteobacteria bacterium]
MSESALNWRVRRNLTESSKSTPQALTSLGEELFQADYLAESIDIFQKSGDLDSLSQVKAKAVEEGNFFLYVRCCQAMGRPAIAGELRTLASKAKANGLSQYESKAMALLTGQ